MSRLNVGNLFNENEDGAPVVSGISTFSSPNYFVPPSGSTAQRPSNPGEGMIRFNTDSGHLEYYSGELWVDVITNNNEVGVSTFADGISAKGTGTRALFASKLSPTNSNVIQYVSISTLGNTADFGDLTEKTADVAGMASRTRGVFAGGYGNHKNDMSFVTFASTGDAIDFGDCTSRRVADARVSSSTRGVMMGHMLWSPFGGVNNTIDYITIASQGDAQDFGDMYTNNAPLGGGMQSSVRGVTGGTYNPDTRVIQYITISTTGNSQDFGDLSADKNSAAGLSSPTRGIIAGGYQSSNYNTIEFITIASTGNAQDFGDQTAAWSTHSGTSSSTRGIFGGIGSPAAVMDFIEIATTGNSQDFGDFSHVPGGSRDGSCSNGHGGL